MGLFKKTRTEETIGVVVDMTPDRLRYQMGGNGAIQSVPFFVSSYQSGNMYPVYEYKVNGVVYRKPATIARGYNQVKKSIGQQKKVMYNPLNPNDSRLVW